MAHDRYVVLERHPLGGFGLSIIGGVDTHLPPMVSALVQNGSAILSGKVFVGDVILEVNGRPITHLKTKEVIEQIRQSQDTVSLRLRDDPGARDRAGQHLRRFAVADPKLPLYQARLKRSSSAPSSKRRSNTDHLPRKAYGYTEMAKKGNSTDDLRTVGRMSVLGIDEGADGTFQFKKEHRTEAKKAAPVKEFPMNRSPGAIENHTHLETNQVQRNSFPNASLENSRTRQCPNCGESIKMQQQVWEPRIDSGKWNNLTCSKCGRPLQLQAATGGSLPGMPYAKHGQLEDISRSCDASPWLKANGASHDGSQGRRSTASMQSDGSSGRYSRAFISNGDVITLGVPRESDDSTSQDASSSSGQEVEEESAAALALRLFRLDGFKREEVAQQLYKNTPQGKKVATEYLKLFDFTGETIMESLRKFLWHFHLKGETQERERILIPFSKRYHALNDPEYGSADAVHTLICAILLLNSDLHGENIGKKMTLAQFVDNLAGLCDRNDFPKDLLKNVYQEVKTSPLEGFSHQKGDSPRLPKPAPSSNGIKATPGNPFLEIQADENAKIHKEGLLYRKVTMGSEGKKTSAWKRKWLPFYVTLKGMIMFLHKQEDMVVPEDNRNCIGVHHSLASRAVDYRKRPFVFRFVTSDWRTFLFDARDRNDMMEWIDQINLVAATFSAPPLPAPIGSSKRFQRPVLPFSQTKLTLAAEAKEELIECLNNPPKGSSAREQQEHEERREYHEYEYKRYTTYVNSLQGSKLESKPREKPKAKGRSADSIMMQMKRSSSLGDLFYANGGYKALNIRESYFMAVHKE